MPDQATSADVALSWGHVNINVTDLERAIDFYRKLGFEVMLPGIPYLGLSRTASGELGTGAAGLLDVPAGTRGRACIMQLGNGFPKLDLTELDMPAQQPPLTNADVGLVRLCLASRDLEADCQRLAAAGVAFVTPPRAAREGLADVALCRDPDGTLIELIQIHPEKWAALPRR